MTEIFENISDDIKDKAEIMWKIAIGQPNAFAAAEYLHGMTEYFKNRWTDEEVDFLRFYFNMRMEMIKQ